MSAEHDAETRSGYGISSTLGWPIGGAVGGLAGAVAFGLVMWLFDPEIVAAAIPSIYGLEAAGITGWTIHLAHGLVLGIVFGFLVTREAVLGTLTTDVETDAVSETGVIARVVAAGLTYGLAVWAILPVLVLPVWTSALETDAAGNFPTVAVESMFGHAAFGIVLGLVFALTIDFTGYDTEQPLEE